METTCAILPPGASSTAIKARVLHLLRLDLQCERCGSPQAKRQPCRTAYADPKENREPILCCNCAEEYHEYWDALWAEYYAGQR